MRPETAELRTILIVPRRCDQTVTPALRNCVELRNQRHHFRLEAPAWRRLSFSANSRLAPTNEGYPAGPPRCRCNICKASQRVVQIEDERIGRARLLSECIGRSG
jgi:hypothetical protein